MVVVVVVAVVVDIVVVVVIVVVVWCNVADGDGMEWSGVECSLMISVVQRRAV